MQKHCYDQGMRNIRGSHFTLNWTLEDSFRPHTVVERSFWTPHALVVDCIALRISLKSSSAVYSRPESPAFIHMLHVHCSLQLTTGCFSKVTSLQRTQEYQKSTKRLLFSNFALVHNKYESHFHLFVCLWCSQNFPNKHKKKSSGKYLLTIIEIEWIKRSLRSTSLEHCSFVIH